MSSGGVPRPCDGPNPPPGEESEYALNQHGKTTSPRPRPGTKREAQQLLGRRERIESRENPNDEPVLQVQDVDATQDRLPPGRSEAEGEQGPEMRGRDPPHDRTSATVRRDTDRWLHLVPEVGKRRQDRLRKGSDLRAAAGRRLSHCRVVPLDVLVQQCHEALEVAIDPDPKKSLRDLGGTRYAHRGRPPLMSGIVSTLRALRGHFPVDRGHPAKGDLLRPPSGPLHSTAAGAGSRGVSEVRHPRSTSACNTGGPMRLAALVVGRLMVLASPAHAQTSPCDEITASPERFWEPVG